MKRYFTRLGTERKSNIITHAKVTFLHVHLIIDTWMWLQKEKGDYEVVKVPELEVQAFYMSKPQQGWLLHECWSPEAPAPWRRHWRLRSSKHGEQWAGCLQKCFRPSHVGQASTGTSNNGIHTWAKRWELQPGVILQLLSSECLITVLEPAASWRVVNCNVPAVHESKMQTSERIY